MKRTLGSTLAAIVLTITTLTIPAQAYTMESDGFTITPQPGDPGLLDPVQISPERPGHL